MNYTSPGAGLPAPDPFPAAAKPKWNRPRRKRANPKNPWFHAYSGDMWRRPYAHEFYRFHIYHKWDMNLCRVVRCGFPGDLGTTVIDSPFNIAAVAFKRFAIEHGLKPVKRSNRHRTGLSLTFWDWPSGFVKD